MSLGAGKFYPSIHSNRLIHFRVVGVLEPIPAYTGNLESPVNPMPFDGGTIWSTRREPTKHGEHTDSTQKDPSDG